MKLIWNRFKKLVKGLFRSVKRFKSRDYYRTRYLWFREHCNIEEKWILVESAQGAVPLDNMAAIVEELAKNPLYEAYRIYLAGNAGVHGARAAYLAKKGIEQRVTLLDIDTLEYYKVLAMTKYLFSGDSLLFVFTKRPEQVYCNTWHGTSLKTMGTAKKRDFALVGNEQKTFFDADYLLCPNDYMKEHMCRDYQLENFAKAKFLFAGQPRNEALLNTSLREDIRKEYQLGDKQVIAYMPTWRNLTKDKNKEFRAKEFCTLLKEWDDRLTQQQVVYVKQHYINMAAVDYSAYKHIKEFPKEKRTYEFLSATDCLVTDYSAVLFDYALTGRKVVLYAYDAEEYEEIRGCNLSLSELPFPVVTEVSGLTEELNTGKQYEEKEFVERFCPYRTEGVTDALCRKVVLGETDTFVKEEPVPYNGKKNVVFYAGGFEKNGVTASVTNLLHNLDREKNNYAVLYCMDTIKNRQESMNVLPEGVSIIGFYFYRSLLMWEKYPYTLWRGIKSIPYGAVQKVFERMCRRMGQRILWPLRIDSVVQFSGYNDDMIGIMEQMPCNRVIYVHSDMEQEIKMRGNANAGLLSHAYKSYDSVAVVTEGMIPPTRRIADKVKEKNVGSFHPVLCRNVIAHQRIARMGQEELAFDPVTAMNVEEETLLRALASDKKKFVSIGRFSVEKGHERLINAFERLHREDKNTCLIIVGGHGELYDKTIKQIEESSCADSVFLVRYMSNPYPLVKRCDYFVLSSLYEGFGLVLAEADILGLPCFTTDCVGPRGFMEKYRGVMVDNNEEGLLFGMRECLAGRVPKKLAVDYNEYNAEAVAQFESML